ncbi:hypothetical protein [Endozoicomonas sp. GU-1]|uniref:hypothetical protein n=1 Tax=Endozoicomonas sp. GU-1 TaxID=3009078 RepID=UPI0022B44A0F|nr:hypothetical protein [Endozoicomonas sp. GU-1]WBA82297.1 hypothetical protein O2T12_03825 [Endozoicomonas sp. GU-1]WBA85233.1 hypothetical protein O3276_18510 [Endozoicomonas sp. GU-1]
MDSVNVYAGCNLNDLNNPARPQRPDSPDENNASGTFSRMCRQVASLQLGAVGPAVLPRETDSESFISNIPGPAHFSGSGTFDFVSQTSLASAGKVTSERDKPSIEDHWYQKGKLVRLIDNLLPGKYRNYLLQEGVITDDEMSELRARGSYKPKAEKLVLMIQKKYQNPGRFGLTKEKILETMCTALGQHQPFLQDCLNKEYLDTHPGSLKSNTSPGNQLLASVDRRNAEYAAAAGRECAYRYRGETKQGCEHDDQGLLKKSGKGPKDDTNNKFSNVKDSFPVQESSVPQQPSLQAPLRFYP